MITDWMRALALGTTFSIGRSGSQGLEGAKNPAPNPRDLRADRGDRRQDRREPHRR